MQSDDPAFLAVSCEVSAKFKGAFCEAKVKRVTKSAKCKVLLKEPPFGSVFVENSQIKGTLEINQEVEVTQGKDTIRAVIQNVKDNSIYHVVFNDGDERQLRRTQLRPKGAKHFDEAVNLDALPLYNPETFSSPVMADSFKGPRGRKKQPRKAAQLSQRSARCWSEERDEEGGGKSGGEDDDRRHDTPAESSDSDGTSSGVVFDPRPGTSSDPMTPMRRKGLSKQTKARNKLSPAAARIRNTPTPRSSPRLRSTPVRAMLNACAIRHTRSSSLMPARGDSDSDDRSSAILVRGDSPGSRRKSMRNRTSSLTSSSRKMVEKILERSLARNRKRRQAATVAAVALEREAEEEARDSDDTDDDLVLRTDEDSRVNREYSTEGKPSDKAKTRGGKRNKGRDLVGRGSSEDEQDDRSVGRDSMKDVLLGSRRTIDRKRPRVKDTTAQTPITSEESSPKKKKTEGKPKKTQWRVGQVVAAFDESTHKGKWVPAVVVSVKAYKTNAKGQLNNVTKNDISLRGFKDAKYFVTPQSNVTEVDSASTKTIDASARNALDRANAFAIKGTLPVSWENSHIFGVDIDQLKGRRGTLPVSWERNHIYGVEVGGLKGRRESSASLSEALKKEIPTDKKETPLASEKKKPKRTESSSSEADSTDSEEYGEERDQFTAQLYKYHEERGTPINKAPILGGKDIDMFRLYNVVQAYGGKKRVTEKGKWKRVMSRLHLDGCPGATPITVKNAYSRYLDHFSAFYRSLGLSNWPTTSTSSRSVRQIRLTDRESVQLQRRKLALLKARRNERKRKEREHERKEKELEKLKDRDEKAKKDKEKQEIVKEKAKDKIKKEEKEVKNECESVSSQGSLLSKPEKKPSDAVKKEEKTKKEKEEKPKEKEIVKEKERIKEKETGKERDKSKGKEKIQEKEEGEEKRDRDRHKEKSKESERDKSKSKDKDGTVQKKGSVVEKDQTTERPRRYSFNEARKLQQDARRLSKSKDDSMATYSECVEETISRGVSKQKSPSVFGISPCPSVKLDLSGFVSGSDEEGRVRPSRHREKRRMSSGRRSLVSSGSSERVKDDERSDKKDKDKTSEETFLPATVFTRFYLGQKVKAHHHGQWYDARVINVKQPTVSDLIATLTDFERRHAEEIEDFGELEEKQVEAEYKQSASSWLNDRLEAHLKEMRCFVHYLGWNARYDVWADPSKIRTLEKDQTTSEKAYLCSVPEKVGAATLDAAFAWRSSAVDSTISSEALTCADVLGYAGFRNRRISSYDQQMTTVAALEVMACPSQTPRPSVSPGSASESLTARRTSTERASTSDKRAVRKQSRNTVLQVASSMSPCTTISDATMIPVVMPKSEIDISLTVIRTDTPCDTFTMTTANMPMPEVLPVVNLPKQLPNINEQQQQQAHIEQHPSVIQSVIQQISPSMSPNFLLLGGPSMPSPPTHSVISSNTSPESTKVIERVTVPSEVILRECPVVTTEVDTGITTTVTPTVAFEHVERKEVVPKVSKRRRALSETEVQSVKCDYWFVRPYPPRSTAASVEPRDTTVMAEPSDETVECVNTQIAMTSFECASLSVIAKSQPLQPEPLIEAREEVVLPPLIPSELTRPLVIKLEDSSISAPMGMAEPPTTSCAVMYHEDGASSAMHSPIKIPMHSPASDALKSALTPSYTESVANESDITGCETPARDIDDDGSHNVSISSRCSVSSHRQHHKSMSRGAKKKRHRNSSFMGGERKPGRPPRRSVDDDMHDSEDDSGSDIDGCVSPKDSVHALKQRMQQRMDFDSMCMQDVEKEFQLLPIDESLSGEALITQLQDRLQELRDLYHNVRADQAQLDRRWRKTIEKRKQRERDQRLKEECVIQALSEATIQ